MSKNATFRTNGQVWFSFYLVLSTTNAIQSFEQRHLYAKQGKRSRLKETYIKHAVPQRHDWNTRRMAVRELNDIVPPDVVVHEKTPFKWICDHMVSILSPLGLSFHSQVELNKMGPAVELLLIDLKGRQGKVIDALNRDSLFRESEAVIVPHGDDIVGLQWNIPIWAKAE